MSNQVKLAQVLAGAAEGGAENFFVRLTGALNQSPIIQQQAFIRQHQHRVEQLQTLGVATQGFSFGGKLDVLGYYRYRQALRRFAPDIVLTWMSRASGNTPASKDYVLVNRLGHYYKLKYYRHADYWIGISRGICQHMIDGGFPAQRVFHIPNFADETPVNPLSRSEFGTDPDQPLVLAAGRLHENKGFDTLLRAFSQVPHGTLWLAGSGPEEQSLKRLCAELKLTERVRFLGWRRDVTALMKTADLFVCPSRHEGLGSIVMESWAHGCPIIATNSQGPGEVISHEQDGLIVPIDDVQALSAAIGTTLEDHQLRQTLAAAGQKTYQAHFSQQVVVAQYLELLQQLKRP